MGHATCAYLGDVLGNTYIYESIDNPEIYILVKNAMLESAQALAKKYNCEIAPLLQHIDDLLHRFTNAALGDTCQRVGGDPARKLSPEDRLIGSGKLALSQGSKPCYIAVGAAAGLRRYLAENELPQSKENALKVLAEVSGLAAESDLSALILHMYELLLSGCDLAQLRREADKCKAESLQNVI